MKGIIQIDSFDNKRSFEGCWKPNKPCIKNDNAQKMEYIIRRGLDDFENTENEEIEFEE